MRLEESKVRDTIHQLTMRIHDRFPSSGIFDVCSELHNLSKDTEKIVAILSDPSL